MKKLFVPLFLFAAFTAAFAQQLTVAVSPFDVRGGFTKDEADVIYELFVSELVTNGQVKVVDRNSFDKIMAEMKFQVSDWSDSTKVAQLGRALNANSIIRGQLMKLSDQLIITASLLDINTAQILSSSRIQLKSIDEIFGKIPGLVKEMVAKIPKPIPNIVGKWGVQDNPVILEFKTDGTFVLELVYEHRDSDGKSDGKKIFRYEGDYKQVDDRQMFLDYTKYEKKQGTYQRQGTGSCTMGYKMAETDMRGTGLFFTGYRSGSYGNLNSVDTLRFSPFNYFDYIKYQNNHSAFIRYENIRK